jgi:uncharacterized protein YutE (UPF0331/DUF86 family)
MTALAVIAEKATLVERHLDRVAQKLPASPQELQPATDAADAVILHLWQATQLVLDLATATCVRMKLGTPNDYADGFRRLAKAGVIDIALAERLARAAGFRNVIAHAYDTLDLARVWNAARHGPGDLRAFVHALGQATTR